MSQPPATDSRTTEARCREKCQHPRSFGDFWKNHLSIAPKTQTDENDVCGICREPYGAWDALYREPDNAMQVHLPNCSHVIGQMCLWRMADTFQKGWNRCPMCRAEWWWRLDNSQPELHDESTRKQFTSLYAYYLQTDEISCRAVLYREQEYKDLAPPTSLDHARETMRWHLAIDMALATGPIQDLIAKFQRDAPESQEDDGRLTVRERFYDDGRPESVFQYSNWHCPYPYLQFAVERAITSVRGERLLEMHYQELDHMYENTEGGLDAVENAWMDQFTEDHRNFVRLCLEVLWVMWTTEASDVE